MTTKEMLNAFFDDNKKYQRRRNDIDREELYAYEERIGKPLCQMAPQEILDCIATFGTKNRNPDFNFGIGFDNYANIAVLFRAFFDWYIDNVEIIKNPFSNKITKGNNAIQYLSKDKDSFNRGHLDKIIQLVHKDYLPQRAAYLECIMRLFVDGLARYEEIIYLREDMIDFYNRKIYFPNRTVDLSDRTCELLQFVHSLNEIEGQRRSYPMIAWRGGYFKFITHPKLIETFDENDDYAVQRALSRLIADIGRQYGFKMDENMLFMFGFYEKLVTKFGEDTIREFVYNRISPQSGEIKDMAALYAIPDSNVTILKNKLKQFIKPQ